MIFWQLLDWLRHQARLRYWDAGLAWGRRGEDLAHRYLRRQGYTIVARNYRTRSGSGEVDLIGWDGDVLAFVEVKTRATDAFGDPERAVDHDKRHHLRVAARDYVRRSGGDWAMARFDVLSVVLTHPPRLTLLKDAFEKSEAAVRGAL